MNKYTKEALELIIKSEVLINPNSANILLSPIQNHSKNNRKHNYYISNSNYDKNNTLIFKENNNNSHYCTLYSKYGKFSYEITLIENINKLKITSIQIPYSRCI